MKIDFETFIKSNAHITDEQWNLVSTKFAVQDFKKGDIIFKKGELDSRYFFVEEGLIRLYSIDSKGREHTIQLAPEGFQVGDRTYMLHGAPSQFYVDVIEDARIAILTLPFIEYFRQVSPEFKRFNLLVNSRHALRLQVRINMLMSANAKERYLDFMNKYPTVINRAPQWMIASYLGITPESLSRVRRNIAKE